MLTHVSSRVSNVRIRKCRVLVLTDPCKIGSILLITHTTEQILQSMVSRKHQNQPKRFIHVDVFILFP
jgi:hypothetical protein